MVRLAQASKDENGRYINGKAGDQTGSELNIRTWYNRPWDTVLRPISIDLGKHIAHVAQILIKNNRIGYDQHQRTTAYDQCSKINWDINKINKIEPCECDCSSLIAVILKFCGISIPKTVYTGNLTSYLMQTGKFICLREPKYLNGDRYLREGDIVLNTAHHVAVCLDNGEKTVVAPFVAYTARVNVNTYLNVRIGPGTGYDCMKVNGKDFQLPNGLIVAICEEANGWGRLSDIQGWVSLSYLARATS